MEEEVEMQNTNVPSRIKSSTISYSMPFGQPQQLSMNGEGSQVFHPFVVASHNPIFYPQYLGTGWNSYSNQQLPGNWYNM